MAAILVSKKGDGTVTARKFNAVHPHNIGRDWDRGPHPEKRLPQETIDKLRADLAQRAAEIGTQKKAIRARQMRTNRRDRQTHSPFRPKSTGYRYLTEAELKVWHDRINKIYDQKVRIR